MVLKVPQPMVEYLTACDMALAPIEEIEIMGRLSAAISNPEALTPEERHGANAEISAFQFRARHSSEAGRWGIYWTEQTSFVAADGTEFVSPDVAKIDGEILAHWIDRAKQTRHPVLQSRYADLAWEIGRYKNAQAKKEGSPSSIVIPVDLCWQAIDAYVTTVKDNLYVEEFNAWCYLNRAIELAISVKHKERMALTKAALYAFSRKLGSVASKWQWWQFDEIVWSHAKALDVSVEERQEAIDQLESALKSCADISNKATFDPHNAMSAADRLQRWRAQANQLAEANRALRVAAEAFEAAAKEADGLTAIAWLEDLIPRYRNAGMTAEAARVEQTIRQRAADALSEMKAIETSVEIPSDKMEQWLSQFLEGSVADGLNRAATSFLIREGATLENLHSMCKEAPLLSMMPITITNGGFTTATIGSVEDDPEGRVIQHAATQFSWKSPWLNIVLSRIREKYSLDTESLMNLVSESPFFAPERRSLVREGIAAWFAEDSVKAIHILVPQIEAALRDMLAALGGAVMTPDTEVGGFKALTLGPILNHQRFRDELPKDIRFHIRALYNDPRGINLRNELAHGLARPELLNMGLVNWVMHTVLLLRILRVQAMPVH